MADKTDPEKMKDTQRICTSCGGRKDHCCGKATPQADANDRQCLWIACWLVVVGTMVAAGLVTLGGCK